MGDVVMATAFADYADAGGLMLPQAISRAMDGLPASALRVSHAVNADIGDLAAPADVGSAPEPGPPTANVTDEELADGVWLLAGQSHHSVLVEFPEYTVLVEAPQHDTRTLAAIERARELVPDKPLRYAVNTHHHFDHSGGIRAAVAEGLTVITHETNRALFEELASRPHTIMADHLAQQPAELMLETVAGDDTLELGEGRRVIQIFRMGDNPHADGTLLVYLPAERMLIQADMFIPGVGGPFADTAAALLQAIQDRNLRVDQLVPIHGAIMALSDLEEAVEAAGN
jgi:glyoxylase-like metal-dependent hydrolase (beta-lactamase superfamily II)